MPTQLAAHSATQQARKWGVLPHTPGSLFRDTRGTLASLSHLPGMGTQHPSEQPLQPSALPAQRARPGAHGSKPSRESCHCPCPAPWGCTTLSGTEKMDANCPCLEELAAQGTPSGGHPEPPRLPGSGAEGLCGHQNWGSSERSPRNLRPSHVPWGIGSGPSCELQALPPSTPQTPLLVPLLVKKESTAHAAPMVSQTPASGRLDVPSSWPP